MTIKLTTTFAFFVFLVVAMFQVLQIINFNTKKSDSQLVANLEYRSGFCVQYNFTKAENTNTSKVSLCAHSTVNFVARLFKLFTRWDGPVSLSLLVSSDSAPILNAIQRARKCNSAFRRMVSVHLVYLPSMTGFCEGIKIPESAADASCSEFSETSAFSRFRQPFMVYPINVMRNVARLGAGTEYHLICDIEMMFSENAHHYLQLAAVGALSATTKNVIVIRRYELVDDAAPLRTIDELQDARKQLKAYAFHHFVFSKGHKIEDEDAWFNLSRRSEIFLTPHHYAGSHWEPQPLLHSSAPLCFEAAPTRHRDMQFCVYELCRAGYTFHIISHVYNYHPGVKRSHEESVFNLAVIKHQASFIGSSTSKYRKLMDERYSTEHACGKFETPP